MSEQHDSQIVSFCEVTGADPQAARHFLEASNWNLENAMMQFFESTDDNMADANDDDGDDTETPAPLGSSSADARPSGSTSKSSSKPRSKIATLGDLNRSNTDSDDEDDKKKQDLYAGGEKSGLAVQNPGEGGRGGGLVDGILRRAAEGGQRRRSEDSEQENVPTSRFSGSGHTLGSDDAPSVAVPDNRPAVPPSLPSVTRTLTFWRDGFSVEDGPLYRYDDPANREILQAIENGRAPLSIMNVEPGQPADVNVFKRLDEDYIPPKKKFVPFSGQGQRLGSALPGELPTIAAAAAAPSPVAASSAAASSSSSSPSQSVTVSVDASAPTTNIQIRLGDGTRLVSRFNHTHSVGELYAFVNASSIANRSRDYVLQTTFPNRELQDHSQTLKEAGLINAVVVQKWC